LKLERENQEEWKKGAEGREDKWKGKIIEEIKCLR
jgi:hypothetical protein